MASRNPHVRFDVAYVRTIPNSFLPFTMTIERTDPETVADVKYPVSNVQESLRSKDWRDNTENLGQKPHPNSRITQKLTNPNSSNDKLDTPMTQPEELRTTEPEDSAKNDTNDITNDVQDVQNNISDESGWIKVIKTVKRKQASISAEAQDPHKTTIQDKIKQRGE